MSRKLSKSRNIYRQLLVIGLLLVVAGLSVTLASPSFTFGAPTTAIGSNSVSAAAQITRKSTAPMAGPIVIHEVTHDTSPPLRSLPSAPATTRAENEREIGRHAPQDYRGRIQSEDPVVQRFFGPMAMPTPLLTFEGINQNDSFCDCAPPDTNGDVGPVYYVQAVNSAYQIFTKTTGLPVGPPKAINTLWTGFPGTCAVRNDGDPIVKYDQMADRWLINQFTTAPPFRQCIAISTTADPNGSYHRYEFSQHEELTRFGDYQKIGVWPDAYYMSNNEFNAAGTAFLGAGNYAFDRTRMLQGLSATAVYFGLPATDWGGQQPSDLDGSTLPPAGAPNLFIEIDDSAWDPPNIPTDQMQMWRFHVDFAVPANSTFTALTPFTPPTLAAFDGLLCNFGDCVPQPSTTDKLDTLADRVMFRVAYRNFGTHQSIVFNHTVDTGTNKSAFRWYELRDIHGTPTIYQQGTYDPDTAHRWMASVAQDGQGNMAAGYTVSSSTMFPSIKYTGRLVTDTLGLLPQGEQTIVNGTGSQTGTGGRWGDYSSLNVDPLDDCTFWHTNEYYSTTSQFNWRTKVGSFKFAGCTGPDGGGGTPTPTNTASATPDPVPSSTSTATATPDPIPSATGTATATPDPVPSSTNTATATPDPSATSAATSTSTQTVQATSTNTAVASSTSTSTGTVVAATSTNTSVVVASATNTAAASSTVAGATTTPVVTATVCTINFPDNNPGDTFYTYIRCLACRGVVTGYPDGMFHAERNITRGQISKVVSNAAGFNEDPGPQLYSDVPPGSTYYAYINRLTNRGIMSGYPCPTRPNGQPCNPDDPAIFLPNAKATRGQLAKIVSNAAGFNEPVSGQIYADVPEEGQGSQFYEWIMRLTNRGVMGGYACGSAGEMCDAQNRPYFRWAVAVTRGQASKIVANTFFPNCVP